MHRRQRPQQRPAHQPPMNPKLCRNAGYRADPKLMLPTELLKQFHFGFPVHAGPPDRAEVTVR